MNKKEQAMKYYDDLMNELNTLGLDPDTSELYKFTANTINKTRKLTETLPAHLLEMMR